MRAKIYEYTDFEDDGLIVVYVDRDMLKVIRECLEEEIGYKCSPETYYEMIQLVTDHQTIADKLDEYEPMEETE